MNIPTLPPLTITQIISAHRLQKSPVGITTRRTARERWAIALKLTGKTYYSVNGKEILSDSTHPVILSKGSSYSWKCVEPGECILIEFDAEQQADNLFSFQVSDSTPIATAFSKIERLINLQTPDHHIECVYLVYSILMFLIKSRKTNYVPKDKQTIVLPAIQYISTHYQNPEITNDLLAKQCGISTIYFRKTFVSVYSISPIRYLHSFRIAKAKSILQSDYESIEQIAESVGYSSIYHFSKMFKQYTGVSPTEFAKASRK